MNDIVGLDKAVCIKNLVHHQVVELFVDYFFSILEPFVVDWNMLYIFFGEVNTQSFEGGFQYNFSLFQSRGNGGWCNSQTESYFYKLILLHC